MAARGRRPEHCHLIANVFENKTRLQYQKASKQSTATALHSHVTSSEGVAFFGVPFVTFVPNVAL